MTAGPEQVNQESEKRPDEALVEDYGEWEPIINDDIELDLANLRVSDLAAERAEEAQAAAESAESTKKSSGSRVVWGKKPVVGEWGQIYMPYNPVILMPLTKFKASAFFNVSTDVIYHSKF